MQEGTAQAETLISLSKKTTAIDKRDLFAMFNSSPRLLTGKRKA